MELRPSKPWTDMTEEAVRRLPGQLGVYQIADASGAVVKIGFAGGRSAFGVRSALLDELAALGSGHRFRVEINMQYTTRFNELLMLHKADHGALPALNAVDPPPRLGTLSPR
ncbi:MAG: hypothetical protein IPK81_08710 [Rhodospirillales bacterium]|nr:MAG: hypothetical protein IPK81_08710 [Rhodospirillales bacterium]